MIEERLLAAFINATWQSLALCALVALALRALQRTSATARCAIWTGVLLVAVALPIVDYVAVQSVSEETKPAAHAVAPAAFVKSAPIRTAALQTTATTLVAAPVETGVRFPDVSSPRVRITIATLLQRTAQYAFVLWLCGVAFFAVRFVYQMVCLIAAKHAVEPFDAQNFSAPKVRRKVRLGLSDRVAVPCLLGLFRPIIALPRGLATELSPADLQRIVLHESAHLQRCDDWFNLVEQVALVVFFFNPALHFIARRIGIEREIACDDHVIASAQNRLTYAECLTELARRCAGRRALIVPGFFTNRRQMLVRVEELLDRAHNGSPYVGRRAAFAIGGFAVAGLALSQIGIPVLAATQCPRSLVPATSSTAVAAASLGLPIAPAVAPVPRAAHPTLPSPHLAPVAPVAVRTHVAPHILAVPRVAPKLPATPKAKLAPATPTGPIAPAAPVRVTVAYAMSTAVRTSARTAVATAVSTATSTASAYEVAQAPAAKAQDGSYADGMSLAGYSGLTVDQLIALHDHGVTPRYISEFKAAGYTGLSVEQLIRMRDHGVDAAYAQALNVSAQRRIDPDELVELRDHGVDTEYLASLARVGYGSLQPHDVIRLRDHGVTGAYIAHIRHDLNPAKLTIDELIRLRDSGI